MTLLKQFKKQKNFCNNLIKKDIRKTLGRNVNSKSSVTEVWKAIIDILKPEKMACNSWKMDVDGEYIEAPEELAEAFFNFFKEKVEILASKIIIDDSIDPLNKLREKVKDLNLSFKLKTVSEKEVFDIIRKLKNKRSSCFDGISSEIMKLSGQTLVAPLTWIINSSIVNGTFPSQWKQACVTPLHKKSDRFQCHLNIGKFCL